MMGPEFIPLALLIPIGILIGWIKVLQNKQMGILTTDKSIAETVEKLSKIPLKHQPGKTWEYSVAVDVLGRFIEVIADQRFDEFLQERIFEPLGMVDTGFYVPDEKLDRFAQLYTPAREGNGVEPAPQFFCCRIGERDYHDLGLASHRENTFQVVVGYCIGLPGS